jgi:hypothetical protein
MARPRSNRGYSPTTATLYWDPNIQAYRLKAPFSQALINFLKEHIPHERRDWDPITKEWSFNREYFEPMKIIVEGMWPGSKILTESDVLEYDRKHSKPQGTQPSVISMSSKFVSLCGIATLPNDYREAKRFYIRAITQYHPDKGGDTAKAAELNSAWKIVEKEVFKK